MKAATKAEIMLDQVTKSNQLIKRLRFCMDHPIPLVHLNLLPSTKASIRAYQDEVQTFIDCLTAQREKILALVKKIPDGEVQLVFTVALWTFGQRYKENALDGYTTPDEL